MALPSIKPKQRPGPLAVRTHRSSFPVLPKTKSPRTSFKDSSPRTNSDLNSPFGHMADLQKAASKMNVLNLYPDWLVSRKDFQDLRMQYEHLDQVDVFAICEKPASFRSSFELKAVMASLKSSPFFRNMKDHQLAEISNRMHSCRFLQGEHLMDRGEKADCLYLIVKGKVGIYLDSDVAKDELGEKSVIGESAAQTKNFRTATVKAHTVVEALRLAYDDYDNVVFRLKLQDFYQVASFLQSIEYFSGWNISKLYRLASIIIVKQYKRGQRVYSIGEHAHDLYIVKEGVVSLKVELDLERVNRWPKKTYEWTQVQTTNRYEKSLRDCSKGEFFGEFDLVAGCSHTSNAICTSETCLLFIVIEEFFHEIFSDKDAKCLQETNVARPSSKQLKEQLEREKRIIRASSEVMLDALNINHLPTGRGTYLSKTDLRKATWARLIIKKKKDGIREDLLQQKKEETGLSFDMPNFRTFSISPRNPLS